MKGQKLFYQGKRQLFVQRRGAALALRMITEECAADLITKMPYLWDAMCGFLTKTKTSTKIM